MTSTVTRQVARELLKALRQGERFAAYVDDPVGFFRDVLKVIPWEWEGHGKASAQIDILEAVAECDRVAVKSGHKVSKSNTATGLALWFIATRSDARVTLTAPTFNQVRSILWRELRSMERSTSIVAQLGGEVPLDPATGVQLPHGNEIRGISTRTPENLAGISAPNQLYIVDESSGYPDELWEVIRGNTAGGAKILLLSNPTKTTGFFFSLFRRRSKRWRLITISSENTPNVVRDEIVVPGIATSEWVREMREDCGADWENHPTYMVRVRGEFPPQGSDVVISLRDVERSIHRWDPGHRPKGAELALGVDVARFGDDLSTIQPVRGDYAYLPQEHARVDGPTLAGHVAEVARQMRRTPREMVRVNIDGIGVGASCVDALRMHPDAQKGLLAVVDINVGENADQPDHYVNLRSQLWFGLAAWLAKGAMPPCDPRDEEMLAPLYSFDVRGRKQVEPKKLTRKTLGRSPDYADAMCLAVYRGTRGTWMGEPAEVGRDGRHGEKAPATNRVNWFADDADDDGDDDGSGGRFGGF